MDDTKVKRLHSSIGKVICHGNFRKNERILRTYYYFEVNGKSSAGITLSRNKP